MVIKLLLNHWSRVTHICVGKVLIIGSDNGLSPGGLQAIIWINAVILLIGHLGTNSSDILFEIHIFSFRKIHLKMSSGKWRPFCLGLSVLIGFDASTFNHIIAETAVWHWMGPFYASVVSVSQNHGKCKCTLNLCIMKQNSKREWSNWQLPLWITKKYLTLKYTSHKICIILYTVVLLDTDFSCLSLGCCWKGIMQM